MLLSHLLEAKIDHDEHIERLKKVLTPELLAKSNHEVATKLYGLIKKSGVDALEHHFASAEDEEDVKFTLELMKSALEKGGVSAKIGQDKIGKVQVDCLMLTLGKQLRQAQKVKQQAASRRPAGETPEELEFADLAELTARIYYLTGQWYLASRELDHIGSWSIKFKSAKSEDVLEAAQKLLNERLTKLAQLFKIITTTVHEQDEGQRVLHAIYNELVKLPHLDVSFDRIRRGEHDLLGTSEIEYSLLGHPVVVWIDGLDSFPGDVRKLMEKMRFSGTIHFIPGKGAYLGHEDSHGFITQPAYHGLSKKGFMSPEDIVKTLKERYAIMDRYANNEMKRLKAKGIK